MSNFRNNEIFRASGLTLNSSTNHIAAGTTNATTGRTGALDISRFSNGLMIVSIANAPTGTNPSLALFFDVADAFGNYVQTSPSTSIGGVAVTASGTTYGVINNGYQMTNLGRIRWTVSGTDTPTFTGVSISIHGRP